jgi:hypothetical protein
MKHIQAFFFLVVLVMAQASAQNVGIGTTNPQAMLHIDGPYPSLLLGREGIIDIRHSNGTSTTTLRSWSSYSVLENTHLSGAIQLRPGRPTPSYDSSTLGREVMINATGLAIGPRGNLLPNLSLVPNAPLDIRADGEVVRITGTNPYISIFSQDVQRGYIQGYTGGLALGSNNADVNIWTNGINRLSVKNNGALAIAGNAGSPGQVLTSSGPGGSPYWGSPGNVIYNSFRFLPLLNRFAPPTDGRYHDIPDFAYSFTLSGNHYVDVTAVVQAAYNGCFGCSDPVASFRLVIDGTPFTHFNVKVKPDAYGISHTMNAGFTLPAGNHTIKWQVAHFEGPAFRLLTADLRPNPTFMKVWMVPE